MQSLSFPRVEIDLDPTILFSDIIGLKRGRAAKLADDLSIQWEIMSRRPFVDRPILRMVRRLMEWTAKTAILDLPTPMHRPSHVTTQCISTEDAVFGPHYEDHLCPDGLALDLVHLEFRTLADALPLGLGHVVHEGWM